MQVIRWIAILLFICPCLAWGQTIETLNDSANYFYETGNYEEAIRLGEKALNLCQEISGKENPNCAILLSNLACSFFALDRYSEAERVEMEAMNILRKFYGDSHPDYVKSLSIIALLESELGNNEEAIKLESEALEIRQKTLGYEHCDCAYSLSTLARFYSYLGKNEEAIQLEKKSLEIRLKVLGKKHPDYAASLSALAVYNCASGKIAEAIILEMDASEVRRKALGKNHPDYAESLQNLASYYGVQGNYSEEYRLGMNALEIRRKALGENHPDFVASLHNLAICNCFLGNYVKAVQLGTEVLEKFRQIVGENHRAFVLALNNLAGYNERLGNYSEAIRLGEKALEICDKKNVLRNDHPDYARILSVLATINSDLGNYSEAFRYGVEAMEIRRKVLGEDHPDYASSLLSLAGLNFDIGKYSESIRMCSDALSIFHKKLGNNHPNCGQLLNNLAICNFALGNKQEAIRLGQEALEIRKKVLGGEHPAYAMSLENLAYYSYALGNYFEASEKIVVVLDIEAQILLDNFSGLSSFRRQSFWNTRKNLFLEIFPKIAFKSKREDCIPLLYDKTALLAKGVLLNTEIEMKKLIEESGDETLVADYQKMLSNWEIYDKQSNLPIAERCLNTDSLREVIQRQEDDLVNRSKVFGDYMRNMKLTWQDVQQALPDSAIAIEFLDFSVNQDSTMYVALTLRKGYTQPHMIPLFELNELKKINPRNYYTKSFLAKLVWTPLEEEMSDVRHVYFSPAGELHKIGIEYLPLSANENICDRYQMHRVSSTRQLVIAKQASEEKKAVLYGGIDYNAAMTTTPSAKKENKAPKVKVDSLATRGSWDYLPGTKEEMTSIAQKMEKQAWNYTCKEGALATEETFKELSGQCPRLLHIGTHGFYMTEADAKKDRDRIALERFGDRMGELAPRYVEDKPMTRSGLLFSGCNHTFNFESIPDDREDGILTAQEIAMLDLRGLDLVVLSACESGLGDLESGEGVFGLQRGFKKAGANTIIMSLWEVSDNATQKLMSDFYQGYLSGMSKYEAFRQARENLRAECPSGQSEPYWSAFIMLDDGR